MDYSNISNEELEQMIEQNDMEATCEMAERYLHGNGIEQNLNRAYQLFHRAETQGNLRAYQGLGYMYEHGILFGQNLELAKDYYAKAGIYKTDFAEEQIRLTNEQKVAAALARSEAPATVMVSSGSHPDDGGYAQPDYGAAPSAPVQPDGYTGGYAAQPSYAAGSPDTYAAQPAYAAPAPQPAVSAPAGSGDAASYANAAAAKAAEAAEAARIAAAKAQEAASAAELAADYARKACQ